MDVITAEQMDVLDRLWDIFESVNINWMVLAYHARFESSEDAKEHYNDIGQYQPSKFEITRRDIKTVVGLAGILYGVKIDWQRVAVRSGILKGFKAKAHHRDLAMLEDRPISPTPSVRLSDDDSVSHQISPTPSVRLSDGDSDFRQISPARDVSLSDGDSDSD
ncbi:hypothetical protein PG996_004536 [Apiospora saccharicola]|uniref:Uncharacterized protein n=1 Tax=Apiospora saccharicola TaxID=335842 RepID=A0ABR1W749_9PEZI